MEPEDTNSRDTVGLNSSNSKPKKFQMTSEEYVKFCEWLRVESAKESRTLSRSDWLDIIALQVSQEFKLASK